MNNKLSLIIKIILVLAGIAVAYFVLKYPLDIANNGCPTNETSTCTADLVELCSPDGQQMKQVPSRCNCGEDADTLQTKGWVSCSKTYPNCPGGDCNNPVIIQPSSPNGSELSKYPDNPLSSVPTSAMSVKYLIAHRSALNNKVVKVKGVVVVDWTDSSKCSPYTEMLCPQPIIYLADSSSAELDSNLQLRVVLNDEDTSYNLGQTVEIRGTVEGNKDSVLLIKTY